MSPGSHFRRPWSSIGQPLDPEPETYPEHPHVSQRLPEASATSLDAVDLEEYARTLGPSRDDGLYPQWEPPRHPPPSTDTRQTPSLTSRATLSSDGHSTFSRSRPFSLPLASQRPRLGPASHHLSVPVREPRVQTHDPEIDVAQFPWWSREWYGARNIGSPGSSLPDIDYPPPVSQFNTHKKSPFDPGYVSDPFAPELHGYFPGSSAGHESSRQLLPWSDDLMSHDQPLHPAVKEERMRMLEREFGQKSMKQSTFDGDAFVDADGKPLIGTVDKNGNLVTAGPKKRLATRALQVILALGASVPAIYAAAAIKNSTPPPPANKPPAFVLYGLSVITLFLLLYLFVFRPCCGIGRRHPAVNNPMSKGMMVLPVQGKSGGKKGGKGGNNGNSDIQVNLIVDPEALKGEHKEEESDDDDADDGNWDGSHRGARRKKRPRRRGIFAGLAMEEDWKRARGWLKKVTAIDILCFMLWGGAFVYIVMGKRCPSGRFNGWCNAYNTSSAAACLLCFAFAISVYFDIQDLGTSKVSPRTRT